MNLILMAAAMAGMALLLPNFSPPAPTLVQLKTNLLLKDYPINGATWTLLIEMVVIPFLIIGYVLRRRLGFWGTVTFIVLSFVALFQPQAAIRMFHANDQDLIKVIILFESFLFMFSLGMLVAEIGSRGLPFLTKRMAVFVLWSLCLLCSARGFCWATRPGEL